MDDLNHLLGAYFYEYWNEHEYTSWQEAVDDYVVRSPERARRTPEQITQLLRTCESDVELRHAIERTGCAYSAPEGDRAWLESVRGRIVAHNE